MIVLVGARTQHASVRGSSSSHVCMYYKCRTCVQGYDITGVFMRNWDNPDEAGDDHQCPIDQVSE